MLYEITSQEMRRDVTGSRTYELDLRLAKFPMPERAVEKRYIRGRIYDVLSAMRTHANAIVGIAVEQCDWSFPDKAEVTAEYLTGVCPYCDVAGDLPNESWRVAVKRTWNRTMPLVVETVAEGFADSKLLYAARPCGDLPSGDLSFVGLEELCSSSEESEPDVAKPYGEELPFPELESSLNQIPLPFGEPWTSEGRRVLGAFGSEYMGICECRHCGGHWYAYTKGLWPVSESSETLQRQFALARRIKATVTAEKRWLRVDFDRGIGSGGITHVAFDTSGGLFEVDGVQGFKTEKGTRSCLEQVDCDFACPELFDLVGGLLFERIPSFGPSTAALSSRRKSLGGRWSREGMRVIDFAIANRFRDYPEAFYAEAYEEPPAESDSTRNSRFFPDVRFHEGLPVHYRDVPAAYESCGLPDAKSIRRLAFRQPWIIAYAASFVRLPFKDVNLLRAFLSRDDALKMARLAAGEASHSIFEYIKQTRGELAAWRMICHPPVDLREVFYLWCSNATAPQSVRTSLDSMPLKEALDILVLVAYASCDESSWRRIATHLFLDYAYTEEMTALQGTYGGVRFCLPKTGMCLLRAGSELHNCLASYVDAQEAGSLVLTMQHGDELVGAVEVDLMERLIIQAKGPCNAAIAQDKAIFGAFEEWAHANGLDYEEAC